jgi:hypothetical protein
MGSDLHHTPMAMCLLWQLAEKGRQLMEKDMQLADKDRQLAEKDRCQTRYI